MNILYIIQQSIYNNEGKWLSADSNVMMGIGIIRELAKKTDWNIYVLVGKLEDFADIKSYEELLSHPRVHFIPYNFPVDAFLNRQHFSVFDFDTLMKSLPKIDIIWNNIVEVSRNIKTYLYYRNIPAKLISSCYWLDCPEINEPKVDKSVSYQWRQFDGFRCSDLVSFTCESTHQAFIENSSKVFNPWDMTNILEKSVIWDFGFSHLELDRFETDRTYPRKILFLNRLSGINYTKHEEFIKAVNQLWKMRQDFGKPPFEVVFTNPSQKFQYEYLEAKVEAFKMYGSQPSLLNREEYARLLWEGTVSVHLYDVERYGGCAMVESLHCDNIIVCPKVFEYRTRLGAFYPFYVDKNLFDLVEILDKALDDNEFIGSNSHRIVKEANKYRSSFEVVSNHVISDINTRLCK